MNRRITQRWAAMLLAVVAGAWTETAAAGDPPKVVEMFPANGAIDVDPGVTEIWVKFDKDMSTEGFSFCGDGPAFPKFDGKPTWVGKRRVVVRVKLKPDHDYELSLNCPAGQNFKSADGTPLEPVPWTFSTVSAPEGGEGEDEAGAPKVVEMFPKNWATDVDPSVTEMWVKFDRDMSTGGFSFCGGGPAFPKFDGKPKWVGKRKVVVKIKLEPDHDYELSLNCPAAQNFVSAEGTPLEPVPWSFATRSEEADDEATAETQKKLNSSSLKQLMKLLAERYSYYDLRKVDWKDLEKKHEKQILGAKSTREWVKETAKMLEAAQDVHMWMKYRDKGTATFQRRVELNFNLDGVKKALPKLRKINDSVYTAKSDDGVGYILITTLSGDAEKELAKAQEALEDFKDCKAMIVDLRPNSGGSEPLAFPIAAWFVKGEKIYSKNTYRDPKGEKGWTEVFDRVVEGNTEPKRFDKPTAVLIGPGVMSSAESFVLMMKQGEKVTLIGQATYGSSGNPKVHKLENNVEIFIPSWKDMLPDGTCFEGQGIKPDIEVKAKAADFKKGDPVIEQALTHLRRKA